MKDFMVYISSDEVDTALLLKKTLLVVTIITISILLSRLTQWLVRKWTDEEIRTARYIRVIRTLLILINVILILKIYFSQGRAFSIMVALVLAFFALAVKDLIVDIVAYFYIMIRKPFSIGQVIEINHVIGELVDIDFLQFNLSEMGDLTTAMTHTGRYISIPNRFIFEHPVFNYNFNDPFVMVDISITITLDSDRDQALRIAGKTAYEKYESMIENYDPEAVEHFLNKLDSHDERGKPTLRAELTNIGFNIYVQFFTAYDEMGKNKMIMRNAIYDAFNQAGIKLPQTYSIQLD